MQRRECHSLATKIVDSFNTTLTTGRAAKFRQPCNTIEEHELRPEEAAVDVLTQRGQTQRRLAAGRHRLGLNLVAGFAA